MNMAKKEMNSEYLTRALNMASDRPFLVGAGHVTDDVMRAGSNALARLWGGQLIEHSCSADPTKVLGSLPEEGGLVQLHGDAAMHNSQGFSWMEALGAWRRPIILMVVPTPSGNMPGTASAYSALCKSLKVPLVGIIQLGGDWDSLNRRLDGLSWCGWLPRDHQSERDGDELLFKYDLLQTKKTVLILRQRLINLNIYGQ